MKYMGMPVALWAVFTRSFRKNLEIYFGLSAAEAKEVTRKAKVKYKKIIRELPEFEKEDHFKMNIVSCALVGAFVLSMPKRPDVKTLMDYYRDSSMTPLVSWFFRQSGKSKFSEKDRQQMQKTARLKAADRNPFSWNMDYFEYPDGSGYEARFYKCGICALMKKLGLYDLTPALCHLDYDMSKASGASVFVREYTLASGGPYCDCGYKKKSKTPLQATGYQTCSACKQRGI